MKEEITQVCRECGISANVLTCIDRFHKRPNKLCFNTSTFHKGICDVCGIETHVTEPRDYFYPDFSLLPKKE